MSSRLPFLTGSQVYGTPKEGSDVDLVILVPQDVMEFLYEKREKEGDFLHQDSKYTTALSIRFGKLNLLCITEKKHYDVWKQGTEELIKQKPVTRDFAVEFLADLRRKHGIKVQ